MSTSSHDPADTLAEGQPLPPPSRPSPAAVASAPATPFESGDEPDRDHDDDRDSGRDPGDELAAPIRARPGDLTVRWRFVLAAAWIAAFFGYAAVWQASVQIGIGTWWIGPRAQPTHTVIRVLPSLMCISLAMCVIYNVPRLVRLSALGVGFAVVGAIPDFSRSTGLAVTELIIAGLLGIVTLAARTGRYRLTPAHPAHPADVVGPDGNTEVDDASSKVADAALSPPRGDDP